MAQANKIFPELSGDEPDHQTTVVESCCMNCFENVSEIQNNLFNSNRF